MGENREIFLPEIRDSKQICCEAQQFSVKFCSVVKLLTIIMTHIERLKYSFEDKMGGVRGRSHRFRKYF